MDAALLLLADGRFPTGGHAHSAGTEAAVSVGDVTDLDSLTRYLEGRLDTTGRVDAAFAAATCALFASSVPTPDGRAHGTDDARTIDRVAADAPSNDRAAVLAELDAEYSARVPSPYLRTVSRRLGRQLLRSAERAWPGEALVLVAAAPGGPHQPVALGAAVAAAGGDPAAAHALALHHLTGAVTTAAVRLLGLDPIAVAALGAEVVAEAQRSIPLPPSDIRPAELPADGGSLTEILGERHGSLDARLFVA